MTILLFSLFSIFSCNNDASNNTKCEKVRESDILRTIDILEVLSKTNETELMDSVIQDIREDNRFLNYSYNVGNSTASKYSSGKLCVEKSFDFFDGHIVNQRFFSNSDNFYIRVREGYFMNVLDNSQKISGFVVNVVKKVNDTLDVSGNFEFSCSYDSRKYAHIFMEKPDSIIVGLNKNYISSSVEVKSNDDSH